MSEAGGRGHLEQGRDLKEGVPGLSDKKKKKKQYCGSE